MDIIIEGAQAHRDKVVELLAAEKLPVADLPQTLNDFVVGVLNGDVIGVAGLEMYARYGLLRSVVVHPEKRGLGIAGKLIDRVEAMGREKGLYELYLLTETAPAYFEQKGFIAISRQDVPVEVQSSLQFGHVCPISAIVMKKEL